MSEPKAIDTFEDDSVVTVGYNIPLDMVEEPLGEPIVYLELDTSYATAVVGLTRDEAMDVIDAILSVLEDNGVGIPIAD